MDLTHTIAAIEPQNHLYFQTVVRPSGNWTDDSLTAWLQTKGFKYQRKPGSHRTMYELSVCPNCNHTEGNPAIWLEDGNPFFKCFRDRHCDGVTFADINARSPAKPQPSRLTQISAIDLVGRFHGPRPSVVRQLIRRGDVVNIVGGPKTRKSFLIMQLLLCIAAGLPFLGWQTQQGKVLLVDNELREDDLASRLRAMAEQMGLNWQEVGKNIVIMSLRGKLADLTHIRDEICRMPAETYCLVVIDALYKALPPNVDENSNGNITQMYVLLDELAERHNSGIAVVHHTSKGSQAQKSVSDMGSGAGAQSRSADVHIVLREHEEPNTVVLNAIIRSQRPIEPMCLTFDYPVWKLAPDKNPTKISTVNKKPVATLDAFLATIPPVLSPKSEVLAASKSLLNISRDSCMALFAEATKRSLIEVQQPSNKSRPHMIRRL